MPTKSQADPGLPSLTDLVDAGAHFGHRRSRSHPKSRKFVYTIRDRVLVINLEATQEKLQEAATATETLAAELRGSGVRVNCVSPGSVDTPMLRRVAPSLAPDMSPAEVAETILFLASRRAEAINGQNIHVYGS